MLLFFHVSITQATSPRTMSASCDRFPISRNSARSSGTHALLPHASRIWEAQLLLLEKIGGSGSGGSRVAETLRHLSVCITSSEARCVTCMLFICVTGENMSPIEADQSLIFIWLAALQCTTGTVATRSIGEPILTRSCASFLDKAL